MDRLFLVPEILFSSSPCLIKNFLVIHFVEDSMGTHKDEIHMVFNVKLFEIWLRNYYIRIPTMLIRLSLNRAKSSRNRNSPRLYPEWSTDFLLDSMTVFMREVWQPECLISSLMVFINLLYLFIGNIVFNNQCLIHFSSVGCDSLEFLLLIRFMIGR